MKIVKCINIFSGLLEINDFHYYDLILEISNLINRENLLSCNIDRLNSPVSKLVLTNVDITYLEDKKSNFLKKYIKRRYKINENS